MSDSWRKTTPHSKTFSQPSRTKKSQGPDQDINTIISRWRKTGNEPPGLRARQARAVYADFSEAGDLMDALDSVRTAFAAFEELPAATRSLFSNDPAALMQYLDNPENALDGFSRGLLTKDDLESMGVEIPEEIPPPVVHKRPIPPPAPEEVGDPEPE